MGDFNVKIDISALTRYLESFAKEVTNDIKKEIKNLARDTHNHILEEAKKKLTKYELPVYEENLSQAVQLDDYLWVITLVGKGAEIENGTPPRDMKPSLLNVTRPGAKRAKEDKDGKKYRIIPMEQGKASGSSNPNKIEKSEELIENIKGFLKSQKNPKLSYSGIEKDPQTGSPRFSKIGPDGYPRPLHVFDIPSRKPLGSNTEILARLHIYQVKNKNGNAKKVMTTFRTVKEEGQEGKWIYPAQQQKNIFSEAEDWATTEWSNSILPKILQKYQGK